LLFLTRIFQNRLFSSLFSFFCLFWLFFSDRIFDYEKSLQTWVIIHFLQPSIYPNFVYLSKQFAKKHCSRFFSKRKNIKKQKVKIFNKKTLSFFFGSARKKWLIICDFIRKINRLSRHLEGKSGFERQSEILRFWKEWFEKVKKKRDLNLAFLRRARWLIFALFFKKRISHFEIFFRNILPV